MDDECVSQEGSLLTTLRKQALQSHDLTRDDIRYSENGNHARKDKMAPDEYVPN